MTTAATATSKNVAYDEKQTAQFKALWAEQKAQGKSQDDIVELLVRTFAKTAKSIVAKASREKLYTAKKYVSKTGDNVEKKEETAKMIGKMLNLSDSDIESLGKANKSALQKVSFAIANSIPAEVLTVPQESERNEKANIIGKSLSFNTDTSNTLRYLPFNTLMQMYSELVEFCLINIEGSDSEAVESKEV